MCDVWYMCVCVLVKGTQIKPDPLATKNSKRRAFCTKHDGYGDFCDGLCAGHCIIAYLLTVVTSLAGLDFFLLFYRAMLCIRGTRHGPVSVHLTVCLSQVGVLLKRLNVGSHKQHHTIPQRF